jgi:hypothetical protein
VQWSYPHSAPHEIRQQTIRFLSADLTTDVLTALESLVGTLRARIRTQEVVLPSRRVRPRIRLGITTIVVQDQTRTAELPLARMYYIEEIAGTGSSHEGEVRLESGEFSETDRGHWDVLRSWAKKRAWEDYESRFQTRR